VEKLGEYLGIPGSSGSLHRLYRRYLRDSGLVIYRVLPFFQSGLAVVRLSLAGQALCRRNKWLIVESEWGRMILEHNGEDQKRHTAMVLCFAREARRRGYQVVVLPKVEAIPTNTLPDIYIEKGVDRAFVEVERGRALKNEKWLHQDTLQGFVAICTLTKHSRRRFMEEEFLTINMGGQITDLETLRRQDLEGGPGSLWLEKW
jgi:hypothetical protein